MSEQLETNNLSIKEERDVANLSYTKKGDGKDWIRKLYAKYDYLHSKERAHKAVFGGYSRMKGVRLYVDYTPRPEPRTPLIQKVLLYSDRLSKTYYCFSKLDMTVSVSDAKYNYRVHKGDMYSILPNGDLYITPSSIVKDDNWLILVCRLINELEEKYLLRDKVQDFLKKFKKEKFSIPDNLVGLGNGVMALLKTEQPIGICDDRFLSGDIKVIEPPKPYSKEYISGSDPIYEYPLRPDEVFNVEEQSRPKMINKRKWNREEI